jgi:uncharacterized OB-fold protein
VERSSSSNATCGNRDHPPFPECTRCRSTDVGFAAVSGNGRIFERAIVRAPVVPGFESDVPYACIAVELDEQPGLLVATRFAGVAEDAVIGARVVVSFASDDQGVVLPFFRLERARP